MTRSFFAAAAALAAAAAAAGCAHAPEPRSDGPTLEIALDDGHAAERPLTPDRAFELLMRFDPALPAWRPLRLRFLLAQPGHLVFTFYKEGADGRPAEALGAVERHYEPALVSTGKDGRWVIESLSLGVLHGPIWLGVSAPGGGGDPRLWASSTASDAVRMRDPDPAAPFSSTKIPRTPMARLEVAPAP
jgi:hypothetical protein